VSPNEAVDLADVNLDDHADVPAALAIPRHDQAPSSAVADRVA